MFKLRLIHYITIALIIFALVSIEGCGQKKGSDSGGGRHLGKIEKSFNKTASTNKIPARYMMAVAYLESGFSPQTATANYPNPANPSANLTLGSSITETAFGLSKLELFDPKYYEAEYNPEEPSVDPANPEYDKFDVQIEAYGAWLTRRLGSAELPKNPTKAEDKFLWIWQLSQFHREGLTQRRNVRVLFALELLTLLNEGFIWQDPENPGDVVKFSKEKPAIDIDDFPVNDQNWFSLDMGRAEIDRADYFPLVTVPSTEYENLPKRIEVIHCPLSLSACLELQNQPKGTDVRLGAHYVIPADAELVDRPLQVAKHHHPVLLTDSVGNHIPVQDAVVIMLVGASGRLVDGSRHPAIPTWFTDTQLRSMGKIINDVCALLEHEDENFDYDGCMSTSGDNGVRFRHRTGEEYRWGEIPDYDPTIFEAYITNPEGLQGEAAFEFPRDKKQFKVNQKIALTVLFQHNSQSLVIERLARCPSGKVVWEPLQTDQVPGLTKYTIHKKFFDAGPNQNGDQFFRASVYGQNDELLDWTIDRIFITGFDEDVKDFATPKYCNL